MDIHSVRQQLRMKSIYDIPLRVTYYARVSSESDEQLNSLGNQIRYYEDFIRKNAAWTFVPGYIDEGLSGISTKRRENFNRMVDGEKNPLPYAGFPRLGFLLKNFTALTDLLSAYLRPQPSDLEDRGFFERSTTLLFYLVAGALAAVANNDPLGRISAAAIPDGTIALEIQDGPCAEITARGGHLITRRRKAVSPRAYMIFSDFDAARGLFDGTLEAMSALAAGKIIMKGYIPMIDNLNRVLNRVPVYLQ